MMLKIAGVRTDAEREREHHDDREARPADEPNGLA